MLAELFNLSHLAGLVLGLVTGLVTGFYFERRATRAARRQHEATLASNLELRSYISELEAQQRAHQGELQRTVQRVQESVYSSVPATQAVPTVNMTLSPDRVRTEIRSRLDAAGRASLPTVISAFVAQGHSRQDVEATLDALSTAGEIRVSGKIVEFI